MPDYITNQISEANPLVVARAFVMHIAEGTLYRIGARAMNFAAASCGVSEEVELFLVELLVLRLCALFPDVLLDHTFCAVLPDGADEVPVRPKLAAP